MAYFGGGGVQGDLHPSLQAYIDSFDSSPFPRAWPRGGGVWDQDPILVRDFREIRKLAIQCKDNQESLAELGASDSGVPQTGGVEGLLDQFIREQEEEGIF